MLRWGIRLALALFALVLLLVFGLFYLSEGWPGEFHARGQIVDRPIPTERVEARAYRVDAARRALGEPPDRSASQILFGDLHVHTTYSADAFVFSLPLLQGEGAHPPADACDFARFCAELDFFSLNDHAENLTAAQWAETKESIRECNAVAGDAENPDLVAFLGWEWTQGVPPRDRSRENPFYGHKNVVFLDTDESRVPARPIGAGRAQLFSTESLPPLAWSLLRAGMALGDWPSGLAPYHDFNRYARHQSDLVECPKGVAVRDLPEDCLEGAETPAELFAKLDDWGFPSLVIPHGVTWGIHAPAEADWSPQLAPAMHDPRRQRLLEVYSGHGAGELWREQRDVVPGPDGVPRCAEPRDGYEPCCWRAGEIIRDRCGDVPQEVCQARVETARRRFLDAGSGLRAQRVIPGTEPEDWLECGQLAGGFLPALDYRPGMSAQFGLAVRTETGAADPALRFGLIASSDNHKARAGAGYKELERKSFSDAYGLRQDWAERLDASAPPGPEALDPATLPAAAGLADPGTERNASYYYTGGLVAVHAAGRDRHAIWDALEARQVYGTSGPRILLWFDLLDDAETHPMGSEVTTARVPRFRVRAAGAFEQRPGCPDDTTARLPAERLASLCRNECYHPGEERIPVERIEVVRIRPQREPDEPLTDLIEDPWRSFACSRRGEGCVVEFEDADFDGSRETLYYVRALQVATPAVNGDPMRCERDAEGRCVRARLCPASGPDFDPTDDCLTPIQQRAWSSPIWLLPPATAESGRPTRGHSG
ncbi:MAG: DUF3604 domain-containing protein [Proteobacteria bacterium]|nr:DUF3604 domain-containing protein [Pseudomonadota bacterium]